MSAFGEIFPKESQKIPKKGLTMDELDGIVYT